MRMYMYGFMSLSSPPAKNHDLRFVHQKPVATQPVCHLPQGRFNAAASRFSPQPRQHSIEHSTGSRKLRLKTAFVYIRPRAVLLDHLCPCPFGTCRASSGNSVMFPHSKLFHGPSGGSTSLGMSG